MPASSPQRWTYTQASPLGDVRSSIELSAEGVRLQSDAPMGPGTQTLRWSEIGEAATAMLDLPAGRGGPDMARWVPGELEWLLLARSGSKARASMWPLPPAAARDAIVAGVRDRLGARWVGERMPLQAAQQRFRLSGGGDTLKVSGLVLAVLAALFVLLVAFVFAVAWLGVPALILFGAWLAQRGFDGVRDAGRITGVPTTAALASLPLGMVELEGRAVAPTPSLAAASGEACAWWDVTVERWSDSDDDGGWKAVMSRHGGDAGVLWIDGPGGRVPVWLRDAELLLQEQTWESGRDALPARGVALLAGTEFAWNGGERVRVRETRVAVDAPVVVVGMLDEARHLPADGDAGVVERTLRALRTGAWRDAVLQRLPMPLRVPFGIAIATIDLIISFGRGQGRAIGPRDVPRPPFDGSTRLVWKGRGGRALIVSNRRAPDAIAHWRKRSWWRLAIGAAIVCFGVHELLQMF